MRLDAQTQGDRWLAQAEADRHGAQLLFNGESYHLSKPGLALNHRLCVSAPLR